MESADFIALLPLLITAGTALLLMIAIAIRRSHAATASLAFLGLAASFASLFAALGKAPRRVTPILIVDRPALLLAGVILVLAAGVVLLCYSYFAIHRTTPEEIYILLILATLGSQVLAASSHFASFFLGLEILSVSLYAMIAYLTDLRNPLEAAIKYLILAAASAAFLLFGMALVYGYTGTMEFSRLQDVRLVQGSLAFVIGGTALIITGVGFKLALVPFHWWTPDVYQGSPAPVTAFIATVSKLGVFALLLRYYDHAQGGRTFFTIIAIMAVASMLAGNLLALRQTNVKRILAYSSIAQLGYVLVALLASGATGQEAVVFYLIAYSVTTLGAFAIVSALSDAERDADQIEDYRGLFWRRPLTAGIFTVMLLSLAGIPVTAGFIGKFYVIAAGAGAGTWLLVLVLIVSSAIGLFYYLRVVAAMYSPAPAFWIPSHTPSIPERVVLGVFTLAVFWLGLYPTAVIQAIQRAF